MSDLRSIAEGTFVLGDTNGLTFEAGPGITVSQPSEGTVRIANDETVLWSGAYNNQGFTTSEKPSNFEYLRIHFSRGGSVSYVALAEASDRYITFGGMIYDVDEGSQFQEVASCVSSTNGINWVTTGSRRRWNVNNNGVDGGSSTSINYITKVVGINRISGGNNE